MEQNSEAVYEQGEQRNPRQGCGLVALFVLTGMWIVGAIIAAQAIGWIIEQSLMDGSFAIPDIRWLILTGFALMIGIPLAIETASISLPRARMIFRTWTMAAVFSLFMVPSRLVEISAANWIAVLRLAGMILFLGFLWRWIKPETGKGWNGIWLAFIAGGIGLIPWIQWGALGSVSDLLLNGMVAVLFGICAALVLQSSLFWQVQKADRPYGIVDIILDGGVGAMALLIMVTGLGQIGTQWMLAAAIPVLGFVGAAISYWGMRSEGKLQNWLALGLLFAFGSAGPLIWVDADELGFTFTGGTGDLFDFVVQATKQNLLINLITLAIAVVLWKYAGRRISKWVGWGSAALISLGLIIFQLAGGQKGWNGDHWFVILHEQAEVGSYASLTDPVQKRSAVFDALVENATESQADLLQALNRWNIPHTSYYLVNAVDVQGGPLLRLWLETRPEVDRILQSPRLRPLAEPLPVASGMEAPPNDRLWNQTMIGVDRVWDELGIRGAGILVGQPDSGVQGDHPEVADGFRSDGGDGWLDPWNGTLVPVDIGGHGTHTLATVLGNEVGMAPDASWIGCVNLARNLGNPAYYLDCWQFLFAPYPQGGDAFLDGNPARGANVFNNSWGCPKLEGCDPDTFITAVEALKAAGVFVVVSAGNSGYSGCGTVGDPPAIYENVLSVGAITELGTLADFSSLGPVLVDKSERVKPDLVAPGQEILSAYPNSTYEYASGTSMAGPHVVGVVALMWSANPSLIGDIETTWEILRETAKPYQGIYPECIGSTGYPNNAVGYGVVDAFTAVQKALETR